jgi:hypothetical protein
VAPVTKPMQRAGIRAHVHLHVMRMPSATTSRVTRGLERPGAARPRRRRDHPDRHRGADADELAAAVTGFRFAPEGERAFYLRREGPRKPLEAPTGIEPVTSSSHAVERNLLAWIERQAASAVALYRPLFETGGDA